MPDEAKGEQLVAFYTTPDVTPQELWSKLNDSDLPKLWIPKRENLRQIEAIPMLGTGKVNLREVKRMAQEPPGRQARRAHRQQPRHARSRRLAPHRPARSHFLIVSAISAATFSFTRVK